jgi:hypothetical protein
MRESVIKETEYLTEECIIPMDVFIDIARIISQAELPHKIIRVIENKNQVEMQLSYQKNLTFHKKAEKNIHDILFSYDTYRNEDTGTINWKDQ